MKNEKTNTTRVMKWKQIFEQMVDLGAAERSGDKEKAKQLKKTIKSNIK